jgi:hypothetical protein
MWILFRNQCILLFRPPTFHLQATFQSSRGAPERLGYFFDYSGPGRLGFAFCRSTAGKVKKIQNIAPQAKESAASPLAGPI